jgi:hypothetical protein
MRRIDRIGRSRAMDTGRSGDDIESSRAATIERRLAAYVG